MRIERLKLLPPIGKNRFGHDQWQCECECGTITTATIYQLEGNGKKKKRSCGCLAMERAKLLFSAPGNQEDTVDPIRPNMKPGLL